MTMINSTPQPAVIPEMTEAEKLRVDLEGAHTVAEGLRNTINSQRRNISSAMTLINDYIEANDLTIDDDIPLSELNDILHQSLGHTLVFDKEYTVEAQWYVYGTFTVRAASEEDAQRQVEEITMYDPSFDEDSDDVTIEFDRVVSLERKG